MILNLPGTNTGDINSELLRLRKEGGVITLGRVMTLVIDATDADAEEAISTANVASREHPCRIVVLSPQEDGDVLDAQIRVGGHGPETHHRHEGRQRPRRRPVLSLGRIPTG